jgi:hypothetical protein
MNTLSQRLCPLWVKNRHPQDTRRCPLYPRKRTFCAAVENSLFDHLVGKQLQLGLTISNQMRFTAIRLASSFVSNLAAGPRSTPFALIKKSLAHRRGA